MNITLARKIVNCEQCAHYRRSMVRGCALMDRGLGVNRNGIPGWCPLPLASDNSSALTPPAGEPKEKI